VRNLRLIARLDIKGPHLIKGIHLEGLRKVGDPKEHAVRYYEQGIDEILYMDIVASLYDRFSLSDLVERTAREIFIPLTVGGGLRSREDVRQALKSGADKVAVNTAAIRRPEFITEISEEWGSQCVVASIEVIRQPGGNWLCFTDNGREHTGRDAIEWAQEAVARGAGELLVTSIDQEGTQKGFDVDLCRAITSVVDRPVILSGGMGELAHVPPAVETGGADAIAMAHVLHYNKFAVDQVREACQPLDRRLRIITHS